MSENNWKRNPEKSYTNKCQKHIACSCGYKVVYVDDKISKPFKRYLGGDAVYNLINSVIEESAYCCEVIKKLDLTKNLWRMKILKILLNVGSVTMIMLIILLKKDIIVISLEKIQVLHIEIVKSILKLIHKLPLLFHNLKYYDCHLIMQEIG